MSNPPHDHAQPDCTSEHEGPLALVPMTGDDVKAALDAFPAEETGSSLLAESTRDGDIGHLAEFPSDVDAEEQLEDRVPRRIKPKFRLVPARCSPSRAVAIACVAVIVLSVAADLRQRRQVPASSRVQAPASSRVETDTPQAMLAERTPGTTADHPKVVKDRATVAPGRIDVIRRGRTASPQLSSSSPTQPRRETSPASPFIATSGRTGNAANGGSQPAANPPVSSEVPLPNGLGPLAPADGASQNGSLPGPVPLLGELPIPASRTVTAEPSAPSPRPSDAAIIQTVVARYRTAMNALDVRAAKAVWPSVDSRALEKAFDHLENANLEFDTCQIRVRGVEALASCDGNGSYVPKIGNKHRRSEAHAWTFKLRKADDDWVILTVDAR